MKFEFAFGAVGAVETLLGAVGTVDVVGIPLSTSSRNEHEWYHGCVSDCGGSERLVDG